MTPEVFFNESNQCSAHVVLKFVFKIPHDAAINNYIIFRCKSHELAEDTIL